MIFNHPEELNKYVIFIQWNIIWPFKVMNYYVGKGICSGFSITCYGKIWANFMANPIDNVICTNMERYG